MKFCWSCYFSLAFLLAAGAQTVTAAESNNSAVTAAVTSKATLTSPAPGSTLSGSSATFTWSAGTGASAYKLILGTSAGGSDVYNSYTTAVTTKGVSGIPVKGATLYATLYTQISGVWSYNSYTYTEHGTVTPTKAALTTPAPSSTLTGSSATFSWSAGVSVTNYKLTLGTTAGGSDVYNSYTTTVTSKGVSGIPTTGATLYATLWSEIGGAWSSNSYTYTEYKGSTPTAITPYILVSGGAWTVESSVTVNSTSTVVDLGPQPISGGSWSWSGPNSFTSTSREIDNIALSAGTNTYTATYTNASGAKSTQAFTITVAVPTAITPYMQVNGGAWTVESSVTVASGATVNLGPQPISGGSWSWSGPNSFTSTSREIDNIALPSTTNTYTATYTNASGAKSTQAFVVTVSAISSDGIPMPAAGINFSGVTNGALTILNWGGFKAAESWTFDDSQPSQIAHFSDIQAVGVPVTYYIITGGNAETDYDATWTQAVEDGDEIGNHTQDHCTAALTDCATNTSTGSIASELDDATNYILQHYPQKAVWTGASPYGDGGYETDASTRFYVYRSCYESYMLPNDTTDPFALSIHMASEGETESQFNTVTDTAHSAGAWQIFLIHTITPTDAVWYNPVAVTDVTSAMSYALSKGDTWMDTVISIGSYWRGLKTLAAVTPTTNGNTTTWSWTLPANAPSGKYLRVTVSSGTLSQNGTIIAKNSAGFYSISLDAGSLTLTQ